MAFHWDDPEWKAEWMRKKAEARARKLEEVRGSETVTPLAHNQETAGSTPTPASNAASPAIPPWCDSQLQFETTLEVSPINNQLVCSKCGTLVVGSSPMRMRCPTCEPIVPPIWNEDWNRHGIPSVDGDKAEFFFNFVQKERDLAVALLRRFYAATRLRSAAGGWQPGKCAACNVPHPHGVCVKDCPCHLVADYLADLERVKEAG